MQSKYGLYLLEEGDGPAFAERLAGLLAGPTTLTLGVLHWLHDNPRVADYAPVIAPLLADPRPDVVFEALQSLRMAGHAPPLCELVALMERFAAHPRVVASAVELLERYAYDDALPRARPHLHGDDPDLVWAAVRALVRGEAPARGGHEIAARLAALAPDEPGFSAILRALLGVDQLAPLLPALAELRDVARVKALVSALGPTMIDIDDPRLVEHIRQDPDCYALNPPPGFASFLRRHGDPERDHATVYGAMGATHPRAGYEAMAVLARWGDAALYRQLLTATSYAPEHAEPALEALFCAYGSDDFDRLAAPLTERRDRVDGTLWAILRAIADDPARAPTLRAWVASQWQREAEVRRFIEVQLRAELPSAFVAGAQSAHFEVAARLLPGGLDELEARLLGGAPDRLALDLLEHLAKASPERAREHAARLQGSGHYGVRACARRLLASR